MLQAHVLATSVFQLEYTINHFPGSNIRAVLNITEAVLNITEAVLWFSIPRLLASRPFACHTRAIVMA